MRQYHIIKTRTGWICWLGYCGEFDDFNAKKLADSYTFNSEDRLIAFLRKCLKEDRATREGEK